MSDEDDGAVEFTLGALVNAAREGHDRMHMTLEGKRLELWGLLDGLSSDQLLALRSILNLSAAGIQYVDGMVSAQLRLQHRVDPDSGEDLLV